jgi:hypothetical protein
MTKFQAVDSQMLDSNFLINAILSLQDSHLLHIYINTNLEKLHPIYLTDKNKPVKFQWQQNLSMIEQVS